MAQTTSTAAQVTDPAIAEFNTLVAACAKMIRKLANASGTTLAASTRVPEVGAFQVAWNKSRDLVADQLNAHVATQSGKPKATYNFAADGALANEIMAQGLKSDQLFGPRTAFAMAYTLWANTDPVTPMPAFLRAFPTASKGLPLWYATNRAGIEAMLLPIEMAAPAAPVAPAPATDPVVNTQKETQQVIDTAKKPPPVVVDFADGEAGKITSVTTGTKSNVPLAAIGLGILVVGGAVLYATRRKGRR